MIRDIIEALGALRGSDPNLNAQMLEWLGRHLGWDLPSLQPHFYGLSGCATGALNLTRAWYPRARIGLSIEMDGVAAASLLPRGAPAPVVAYALNPANALLAANFTAYALRQAREAEADAAGATLMVAA